METFNKFLTNSFLDWQVQDTEKSKSFEVDEYDLIIKETKKLIEVLKPHMVVREVRC